MPQAVFIHFMTLFPQPSSWEAVNRQVLKASADLWKEHISLDAHICQGPQSICNVLARQGHRKRFPPKKGQQLQDAHLEGSTRHNPPVWLVNSHNTALGVYRMCGWIRLNKRIIFGEEATTQHFKTGIHFGCSTGVGFYVPMFHITLLKRGYFISNRYGCFGDVKQKIPKRDINRNHLLLWI